MANRLTVNGKTYTARAFDFDTICDLEDMGVTIERINKMPMSLVRAYFALCAGIDTSQAAEEIQKHLIGGGKLDDISEAMAKEMDSSDFFRSISQNEEQEVTASKRKKNEPNEE